MTSKDAPPELLKHHHVDLDDFRMMYVTLGEKDDFRHCSEIAKKGLGPDAPIRLIVEYEPNVPPKPFESERKGSRASQYYYPPFITDFNAVFFGEGYELAFRYPEFVECVGDVIEQFGLTSLGPASAWKREAGHARESEGRTTATRHRRFPLGMSHRTPHEFIMYCGACRRSMINFYPVRPEFCTTPTPEMRAVQIPTELRRVQDSRTTKKGPDMTTRRCVEGTCCNTASVSEEEEEEPGVAESLVKLALSPPFSSSSTSTSAPTTVTAAQVEEAEEEADAVFDELITVMRHRLVEMKQARDEGMASLRKYRAMVEDTEDVKVLNSETFLRVENSIEALREPLVRLNKDIAEFEKMIKEYDDKANGSKEG